MDFSKQYSDMSIKSPLGRRLSEQQIMNYNACNLPRFYRWGGNSDISFGWRTGRNNDLICIRPRIGIELKEPTLSILLSPICSNRFLALFAFIVKVLLMRIDQNLKRYLEG